MKDAEPANPSASTLTAALLEYYEAPGKYQLTLRQPAVLFSSIRDILQLASGRGAAEGPDGERLCEAAQFFIRAALLYPGADHYAVIGAAGGEVPTDLKERYRLLMRLIHPDFAHVGAMTWPSDAATRVNRAYETLSSPVLRSEYDDQLAALRSQRPPTPAMPPVFQAAARRADEHRPRLGKRAAWVFGLAVGIPAVLLLLPRSEPVQLVQRAAPAASAQRVAEVTAEAAASSVLVSSSHLPPVPVQPASLSVPPSSASMLPPAGVPAASAPPVAATAPSGPALPRPEAVTALSPPPAAHATSPAPPPAVAARPSLPPAAVATLPAQAARVATPLPPVAKATPVEAPRAPQPPRDAPPAAKVPVPPALVAETVPPPLPVAIPAPAPAPAPVITAANTPAPVATVAPSVAPAGKLTATLSVAALPTPTLADAQPLLTQVLQMLETGSGEQLLRLLDSDARSKPAAQALQRQYEQMVKSGRPIVLTQVEFNGEPRDGGVLLVTGRMRLHVGEPTVGAYGQKLQLRAEFAQRGGKVQLTGLSGSPD